MGSGHGDAKTYPMERVQTFQYGCGSVVTGAHSQFAKLTCWDPHWKAIKVAGKYETNTDQDTRALEPFSL